jgi:hypothetical protein
MSNNFPTTINNKKELDNKDIRNICNAFDCSNRAIETIDVKAGKFGIISLSLCSICIRKFQWD